MFRNGANPATMVVDLKKQLQLLCRYLFLRDFVYEKTPLSSMAKNPNLKVSRKIGIRGLSFNSLLIKR